MNITLQQLQVFLAVARHENLGRAAEDLFITRGAVSQALNELERRLGVQLFDRIHPHIRLNHDGERLRPPADELLHRMRDIGLMFVDDESERYLSVGASRTIGSYLLPNLVHDFAGTALWLPEAHIANSHELCEQVASFALDVALLEGEEHHPDLVFEDWLADQMVVVAHKEHPLANGERHSPSALQGQRWILREPASGTRDYFEYNLGPLIGPFEVAFSLNSPEAILRMVETGMGVTFTSRMIVELPSFSKRFAVIHLNRSFSRTFSICRHAKKHHSAALDQFLRFCMDWYPGKGEEKGTSAEQA